MPIVFCDVDGTLRRGKNGAVSGETIEAASRFIYNGNTLYLITGAPVAHLPRGWKEWTSGAYVELGGVLLLPTGEMRVCGEEALPAIERLRARLGIEVDDGWAQLPDGLGSVIVDGGRSASLTLLTGTPPHYPGLVGDAALEDLVPIVQKAGLQSILGGDTVYRWLDCVLSGKETAVQPFLGKDSVFYLGDDRNDVGAMKLPGVIPIGFANSISRIRELAQKGGTYIDLPGPEGGVAEFFRRLNNGKL